MTLTQRLRQPITLILAFAFVLRLGYGILQDPLKPYDRAGTGGDEWWYLEFGYRQVVDVEMEPLSTAPLYVLMVGGIRWLFQPEGDQVVLIEAAEGGGPDVISVPGVPSAITVRVLRALQAVLSTATLYAVYRMTWLLSGRQWAGWVVVSILALSIAHIVLASQIMTETVYLFVLSMGMWRYLYLTDSRGGIPLWHFALVGGWFGLATLTRAVVVLFPLGLALHAVMVWMSKRKPTALTLRGMVLLLVVYTLVASSWTVYYRLRWDEWVVGAKGLPAFFFLGTQQGGWQGPEHTDEAVGATSEGVTSTNYTDTATAIIRQSPLNYVQHRTRDLARATLQPFGTVAFPGESIWSAFRMWWARGHTVQGLGQVIMTDGFLPKLAIYIVQFSGLVLGVFGLWFGRNRWHVVLPVLGLIMYINLVHFVLLALPRYLFPTMLFWWCLAGITLVGLLQPAPRAQHDPYKPERNADANQKLHHE